MRDIFFISIFVENKLNRNMGRIKMTNEQKIKFIKENIQIYIDKNPKKNTPLVEGWENFDDVKLQDLYIKVQNAKRDFDNREMQKSYNNSAVFKNSRPMALYTEIGSMDDDYEALRERQKQLLLQQQKIEQQMKKAIIEEIEKKQKQIQELSEEVERLKVELTKYE